AGSLGRKVEIMLVFLDEALRLRLFLGKRFHNLRAAQVLLQLVGQHAQLVLNIIGQGAVQLTENVSAVHQEGDDKDDQQRQRTVHPQQDAGCEEDERAPFHNAQYG